MIIKTFPDKQKAKSIFELVLGREEFIKKAHADSFPTIKTENYYEIIKELSTILLLLRGFKSTGKDAHKDLFDFLLKKKLIAESEHFFIQDLRVRRNKSSYEGKPIPHSYLENHEKEILEIISKLKKTIKEKLQ